MTTRYQTSSQHTASSLFFLRPFCLSLGDTETWFTVVNAGHRCGWVMSSWWLLALVLSGLVTRAQAMAVDELTIRMGTELKTFQCEVIKETLDFVQSRDAHGRRMPEFRGDQVVDIKWDIPGYQWRCALNDLQSKRYESASSFLKELLDDASSIREVAHPCVQLRYGQSLYYSGKKDEALKVLSQLMELYPKSRYVLDAADIQASIYIAGKAPGKLADLGKRMSALGPRHVNLFSLYEAEALIAAGKKTEAAGMFAEVMTRALDSEVRELARLGQARCSVLEGDLAPAREAAENALRLDDATPRVLASAHLVLGQVLQAEARSLSTQKAIDTYLDAVLEFMRVRLLYPDQNRRAAEALFRAGDCFKMLSKFPGRGHDRKRAVVAFSEVAKVFPNTRWAHEAEQMMKTIR